MKKKALVIRFSSLGDIILTTPVIRCLHLYGQYEVHLLTHDKNKHVLQSNNYLHKIHGLESNLWKTSRKIKAHGFDIIVDLHKSMRSYPIRLFLARKIYGFNKLRIKRWFRTQFAKSISDDDHIALRFLGAIKPLGIKYDEQGLDYFIKKEEIYNIFSEKKKTVALVPGARAYTKTVPLDILSDLITRRDDIHFHILGGDLEKDYYAALDKYQNTSFHCGNLSLGQSASVLSQCELVITTDTALMHIAAALDKKIISIWGGTVPEFGFYPFLSNFNKSFEKVEVKNLKCRPCSKSGRKNCPYEHFNCMNQISTEEIQQLIKKYL